MLKTNWKIWVRQMEGARQALKAFKSDEQSPAGDMTRVNHESQPCLPSFPWKDPPTAARKWPPGMLLKPRGSRHRLQGWCHRNHPRRNADLPQNLKGQQGNMAVRLTAPSQIVSTIQVGETTVSCLLWWILTADRGMPAFPVSAGGTILRSSRHDFQMDGDVDTLPDRENNILCKRRKSMFLRIRGGDDLSDLGRTPCRFTIIGRRKSNVSVGDTRTKWKFHSTFVKTFSQASLDPVFRREAIGLPACSGTAPSNPPIPTPVVFSHPAIV